MTFAAKLACLIAACSPALAAQQSMGSVSTADAKLSGGLEVAGTKARLLSNATVTAYDRTAQIDLDRGGLVQVCALSGVHLLRSGTADALLFTLDSGAMELHTNSRLQDAILTPDLRFTMGSSGPLDLRMRVTREGDTCVENRGATAPVLQITEAFGDAQYRLAPGQHVLFEHGHLREVVDNERSNCGCPPLTPRMVASVAANATSTPTPAQAAAQNPFPVAESAGLAAVAASVPLPTTSTATLTYGTPSAVTPAATPLPAPVPVATQVSTEPPPSPPGAHAIAHKIGGFFHRLFHPKSKTQ